MTPGSFSHFLVNRWLHGPGSGTLFDGLGNASGTPMSLVARDGSEHEMHVEIHPILANQNT